MNNITIDFVVLTHNSLNVAGLLAMLTREKQKGDKIIILDDSSSQENLEIYKKYPVRIIQHKLEKDYAAHRNSVLKHLNSTYSLWLDDDEIPSEDLLKNLRNILHNTGYPDLIGVPRRNIFTGALPIHALKYNWHLDGEIVNWTSGDFQGRIMRNKRGLKWEGLLHERITYKKEHKIYQLPLDERLALIHRKTITEQVTDNDRYNQEYSAELNKLGGSYSE